MVSFGDLPFPLALALLAGLTVVGVAGLLAIGFGPFSLVFLLVTGALAALYLSRYRARAPTAEEAGGATDDDEGDLWVPEEGSPSAPSAPADGPAPPPA